MATWKLAPALAAGNCVVLKPAESTPIGIMVLMDLIKDLLPPGVVNVVNGFGPSAGEALASSRRIAKIAFTGSTAVGKRIAAHAARSLIPATLELGGKSPNVFFADIMSADDEFFDKALEGFALFAFNSGEVCTSPTRALVQESIYEAFIARAIPRVAKIIVGNPLDTDTQLGAQASKIQFDRIMAYMKVGKEEGAVALTGGDAAAALPGDLAGGYYIQPTVFRGDNTMRVFREEIFGPVLGVTTFKDEDEAIAIANDTPYGLGAGVWTRDGSRLYRVSRAIKAGRVWGNNYHVRSYERRACCLYRFAIVLRCCTSIPHSVLSAILSFFISPFPSFQPSSFFHLAQAYPAHAAFGGFKESGIGRETYLSALSAYQQTKNMLISYSPKALGFF